MPSEAIRRHQKLDGRRDRTIRMTSRHLPEQVEQEGGIVRRLERVDIEVGQPAQYGAHTRHTTLVSGRVEGEEKRAEKRAEAIRQQSEHTASTATKRAHGSCNSSRHRRGSHVRASSVGGGLGGGGYMWRARNTIDDQVMAAP